MTAFASSRPCGQPGHCTERRKPAFPSIVRNARTRQLCCLGSAYRLARVLRRWRRQPFEVAFEIGVIDLDEVAALKRIGAGLELRAEDFEHDADVPGRHL